MTTLADMQAPPMDPTGSPSAESTSNISEGFTPGASSTSIKQSSSPTASIGNENFTNKTNSNGSSQPNNAKRPSRKNTLTQQQRNQKRQRATQEQLSTLEYEFNKNPTPTANVREAIAEKINMTERSVQIWFQNRRAKIKLLAKKSLETGEDVDSIPESMRAYLAMQAMESGKSLGGSYLGRTGLMPFAHSGMYLGGDQGQQGKVLIHHLTCRSLSIGKWMRVGQNTMDLIVFYSPDKCTMTYYINNEQAGYKIEYPFSYIKNIYLENSEDDRNKMGGIVIELNRPPNFFMDQSPTTNGFYQCSDFTEDLQASHCLVHQLGGNPKVLSGQMAKLISLESFMNRHNHPFADAHALSMSAPVSPTVRPSSQPTFPAPQMSMFPDSWGMNQMHSASMRPPQGHKRQRSRSVPGPVDFAMFQNQPMPSFYIQPPSDMGPPAPPQQNLTIYAPAPQQPGAMGANLRIDTQAGFGLDMRQYPMSATTASPAEFPPSPGYFHGVEAGSLTASHLNAQHGNDFLSPMVGADNNGSVSVSPMPFSSAEPSIVEQSPPMAMLGRPGSADAYPGNDGSCAVSEDGHSLNEMYSKHVINLPLHLQSSGFAQQQQQDLDMDQLVQFDSVDPSSLSPETMPSVAQ